MLHNEFVLYYSDRSPEKMVYRQLGDSNSQWHKKKFKKVPVGGSASWGKCQLGEVVLFIAPDIII